MLFRDDLHQATQRVEVLERELVEARANRDHLTQVVPSAPITPASRRDTFAIWQWWPVLVGACLAVGYLAGFGWVAPGDIDGDQSLLGYALLSGATSAGIYSLDVILRACSDNERTALNRLVIVLACVAAAPAAVVAYFTIVPVLAILGPVIGIGSVLVLLLKWIFTGSAD